MIYDVLEMERNLYQLIEDNPENADQIVKEFLEKQKLTKEQVLKLLKTIKNLDYFIDNGKQEIDRINKQIKRAGKVKENIKNYLTPYAKEKGKSFIGTFYLSNRVSKQVVLSEAEFNLEENKEYVIEKVELKPDKKKIKEALEKGEYIHGASLVEKDNLQIK